MNRTFGVFPKVNVCPGSVTAIGEQSLTPGTEDLLPATPQCPSCTVTPGASRQGKLSEDTPRSCRWNTTTTLTTADTVKTSPLP
ncbi:hypothetical protein SRHO_G00153130 [Serrasalmus rhombeus]